MEKKKLTRDEEILILKKRLEGLQEIEIKEIEEMKKEKEILDLKKEIRNKKHRKIKRVGKNIKRVGKNVGIIGSNIGKTFGKILAEDPKLKKKSKDPPKSISEIINSMPQ